MTSVTDIRSWSQYSNYRNCPKSWYLAKIARAKRRPGPWLPAGTAVHTVIERYLLNQYRKENGSDVPSPATKPLSV